MGNQNIMQSNLDKLQSMTGNNAMRTRKPLGKKWLWIGLSVVAIICALIVVLITVINTPRDEVADEGDEAGLIYEKFDDYGEILNIFANINDGMSEVDLDEIIERSGASNDYLQINKEDGSGYIATTLIEKDADYSGKEIEFISFDYAPADEENELDQISNIVFHSYHDGKYDYIAPAPQYEYVHVYGDYANSFDNVIDAIDDYLMRL
ncbi:hypothetical protein IKF30_01610 [Candidatus Saccharibacteria bacterium]|nr:hypothetical protein [Candidatus Saccharibacteria bacterium]